MGSQQFQNLTAEKWQNHAIERQHTTPHSQLKRTRLTLEVAALEVRETFRMFPCYDNTGALPLTIYTFLAEPETPPPLSCPLPLTRERLFLPPCLWGCPEYLSPVLGSTVVLKWILNREAWCNPLDGILKSAQEKPHSWCPKCKADLQPRSSGQFLKIDMPLREATSFF